MALLPSSLVLFKLWAWPGGHPVFPEGLERLSMDLEIMLTSSSQNTKTLALALSPGVPSSIISAAMDT